MSKDWNGNKAATFATLAASNHSKGEREVNDYYATEPKAVELLLQKEKFSSIILEPSCGEGHISRVLLDNGYAVKSSDLIDRGFGEVKDFFEVDEFCGDIITNPPYKVALDFVKHSLDIIPEGSKVAMFLKLQFLEGKARKEFYKENPPKKIYVASGRLNCAKNGKFEEFKSSAVAYAWFMWEKGYQGSPEIDWIN
ncbi:MAG: NAD(P)-dependent oxidoreductase [Lactococcus lactis]|uniref:NAD(P)-dependent oxidoreductase n=1 Tax=Lactococcus lactis TaxID=1358 RepID=UPI0025A03E32|nr:NAD(P)-dependent oxidoreductase [Lactococcus lactis]MDM7656380.1 NAD(P)-dependent oxidoreductase [Lactococcus lactis]